LINVPLEQNVFEADKITPGYQKYIVDKKLTTYHCGLPMKDSEIHDVFSTLDIQGNNYITSEEVAFFMNIIGFVFGDIC
jgi:Ca2+-binding EF-hand superfamily protein